VMELKPRALDTAPVSPKTPPAMKAKGRRSQRQPRAAFRRTDLNTSTPPATLAYCGQKMVLTSGATLAVVIYRDAGSLSGSGISPSEEDFKRLVAVFNHGLDAVLLADDEMQ